MNAGRYGAAYIAIAHNTDSLPGDLFYVELLPHARYLVADHAPKILGEVENRRKREFCQRQAEDPTPVGKRHLARNQLREKRAVQSGRTRMHPANILAQGEDLAQHRLGSRPTENDDWIVDRTGKSRRVVAHNVPQTFEHVELRIVLLGYHQNRVFDTHALPSHRIYD